MQELTHTQWLGSQLRFLLVRNDTSLWHSATATHFSSFRTRNRSICSRYGELLHEVVVVALTGGTRPRSLCAISLFLDSNFSVHENRIGEKKTRLLNTQAQPTSPSPPPLPRAPHRAPRALCLAPNPAADMHADWHVLTVADGTPNGGFVRSWFLSFSVAPLGAMLA